MTHEKAVMNMCALIRFALAASVLIVLTVALDCRPVLASEILLLRYHGVINPVSAQYLETGLEKARKDHALAVVLELDTPGGLDLSMRSMVKAMLASPIPVIVFVAPSGSRAASSGVFLVYASSLAAMAPGTNLGAAHPVTLEGPAPGKTMQKKMENDAAAYIGSIATKRGRNAQWAMEAVRKSVSIGAEDALKKGVIDLVAPDLPALMTSLDGRTVPTGSGTVTLRLTSARVREYPLSVGLKALRILSEPQVAFLLMTLGFWGIVFELSQPGMVVPGVVGVMSLALAFYAFQTLPFHWAGILLILLGFVFLLLEVKIPSYGVLTSGGLLSMILGGFMLDFDLPHYFRIPAPVIIGTALVTAVFLALVVRQGWKTFSLPSRTGPEAMLDEPAVALTDLNPDGEVRIYGEDWHAVAEAPPIPKGTTVRVTRIDGFTLHVQRTM